MTTLAEATAAPVEITLGGRSFRMSPLSDLDISELDLWVRGRILRTARAGLPPDASPDDVKEALTAAHEYARSVSWLTSATQELATLDGLARFLWVCLRKHHPGLTDSEVRGLIMGDPAGVVGAMDMFDLLHNTGPAAKKNGPAKGRMASQRGGTSTRRRKSTRH